MVIENNFQDLKDLKIEKIRYCPSSIASSFIYYQKSCDSLSPQPTTSHVSDTRSTFSEKPSRDDLYREASANYATGLNRLARAYEADSEQRRDLLQEIHLALWRSLESFEARCSLRTWVYRVAHNTAMSHVVRQCQTKLPNLVTLEELDASPDRTDYERVANERMAFEQLLQLIHRLRPPDREVMLLYLEDLDAPSIAEITGMSPGNVRNQIYKIKKLLSRRFHGGRHDS